LGENAAATSIHESTAFQDAARGGRSASVRSIHGSRREHLVKTIRSLAILVVAGSVACGGATTSPTGTAAVRSTAASYQSVGQDMSTAVTQYQAATTSLPDVATCQAAEAAYETNIGPMIQRMQTLSGTMDHYMSGAMGTATADMDCVAAAMAAEYARHQGIACTADVTADRTEAAGHATMMAGWIDHQRVRYEQMGEAMGITPSTSDTTWACVHNSDGTFTMNGQTWTPPQVPSTTSPTPTTTPTTSPTTTPAAPSPWPMPCGGWDCPCR
jgi:hypothetical protein